MGKHSGYSIYSNSPAREAAQLGEHDWSQSKAGAIRRADMVFQRIYRGDSTMPLVVVAVDPDTGQIIGGRMDV